jgi:hypothetical protein
LATKDRRRNPTKKSTNSIRILRYQPLPQVRFRKDRIVSATLELCHGRKIPLTLINQAQHQETGKKQQTITRLERRTLHRVEQFLNARAIRMPSG